MGSQDQEKVEVPSRETRGTRVERPAPDPVDTQLETEPDEPLFEVLTEQPNGHRTVIRLRAKDRAAAEKTADVPEGVRVLGVAEAGTGLGSGG
jgi:hypothetical protein